MDLQQIRQEIDTVDKELVSLLEKRMFLVEEVTHYKKNKKLPVLDINRERQVLRRVSSYIVNKKFDKAILSSMASILEVSRDYQNQKMEEGFDD
ncbi:chorismate mutase [Streptococcus catagoni]|uniref:chorismate mutase n=1 Tax=Streptococcus catagoni TaxID=2654874 RepID=UPI00140CCFF9|nr:chorismate mutase [Streptococcus catagoni]